MIFMIFNNTSKELEDQTYYAVQYGMISTMAYYSKSAGWFIMGESSPLKNKDLKNDLFIFSKVMNQQELNNLK